MSLEGPDRATAEAERLAAGERALDRAISADRLGTFLRAAGGDPERARTLYVWDRDFSAALLADIAILEVAARNAMHEALSRTLGVRWYEHLPLDDRSSGQLANAWKELPNDVRRDPADPALPGRLVARCMFGFWTNLLDSGGYYGRQPRRIDVSYEDNWRAGLSRAFPGGKREASSLGQRYTRAWTHERMRLVNVVRNRAAHHEPFVNGCPLPGQSGRRLSAQDAHEACRVLARMLDRNLAAWLDQTTRVPGVLLARPSAS